MKDQLIPILNCEDRNSIILAVDIAKEHLDELELRILRRELVKLGKWSAGSKQVRSLRIGRREIIREAEFISGVKNCVRNKLFANIVL